jgi:hypothetical protein
MIHLAEENLRKYQDCDIFISNTAPKYKERQYQVWPLKEKVSDILKAKFLTMATIPRS